jgi:hypothetical protein
MSRTLDISRRFLRSVNLARDCGSATDISGYIVTPSVRAALFRLVHGLADGRIDRAFALTGPYGSGKSSFGLFLFHLLRSRTDASWKLLRDADPKLAEEVRRVIWPDRADKSFAFLPATAGRQSVQALLADAVDAFSDMPSRVVRLSRDLRTSRDTKDAVAIVEKIADEFRKVGYRGIIFVLDEFGLVFDNARVNPREADVSILQELAETASRREDASVSLIGILHQGFADYASSDAALRKEFSKIEGRFDTIAFSETPAAQMQLVAAAINSKRTLTSAERNIIKQAVKDKVPSCVGLSNEEFTRFAEKSWPIHPLALAALPILFRRLGQNERSVFTFLVGNEPNGLQDFWTRRNDDELVTLVDIYDYLFTNFETHLSRHSFGQALLDAHAALESKPSLSKVDAEIIKTVALLSSLGSQSMIRATEQLVHLALAPEQFGKNLVELVDASILVFRRFSETYALWSGSDIDLRECEKRADAELSKSGFSIAETLARFVPPAPMVARRHSLDTGSLRFFETRYVDCPSDLDDVKVDAASLAAGLLVVCLPERESEIERFVEDAKKMFRDERRVVFAVPTGCAELKEALKEVRRLHWIEDNEKELRDDRIASREVAVRLAEATQLVVQRQFGLLDPRQPPIGAACVFVYRGRQLSDIISGRALSRQISAICDDLYRESPRVRNELVNRRTPSSQAASARNALVKRLNNVETCATPGLGIEGYPPERSIYESVILSSEMHKKGSDGKWHLMPPGANAPTNLLPAWNRLAEIIFALREKPVTVKEIYAELRQPPYGMLDGLLPLLVISFFLVNRDEVFLYYEGTFQPEPSDAHFELLVRRPELFALSGMRISGTRAAIVKRLAAGLGAPTETLMSVVRKLYGLRNSLSKYALETSSVSEKAKSFRKAFEDAKSPEVLLFRSLPAVFDLDGIAETRLDKAQLDQYFNGLNACLHELGGALPKLVSDCRAQLLDTFGFENNAEGWRLLFERSCTLIARLGPSDLGPFLQNVKNTDGDWNKAAQVMSFMVSSPMEKWGPLQLGEFTRAVTGLAERFKAAWRPYDGTAALSAKEEKAAAALLDSIHTAVKSGRASVAVRRAALLRALAELDAKEAR